jgi:hypothetical protein
LDLIFVGTSNCIFDDDLLSKFKSKEKIDLVSCPHETNLVLYEKELDKNDYYLIGVDTARSLSGAYNSIEIFSFAKFNQIAEFNYRLGSFTKYGEIISFIFKWLRKQVGNNIILCIESNTIGLAPIEHLLNHVHDVNFRDFIYKEPKSKEWGISTTGISKDMMIGCLTEIIKEDPSVIKSQDLINQMSAIERNRGGSISSETFSDLFMASCFNAYVRKMKASEILPQINMGKSVYDAHRIETLSSFVNLNTNIVTPQEEFNKLNNMYNEYEIEQLMLLELEKKNTYQGERDEYFSPFL